MKCAAIVAAGGSGSRLNPDTPKQLLPFGGCPLFLWSVNVFLKVKRITEIAVAVPADRIAQFQQAAQGIPNILWATGGVRRQDSVRAGLRATSSDLDVVLVHDAARPLITPQLVDLLIDTAHQYGAAIPVTPVTETLKAVLHSRVVRTLDRSGIFCAQTPQAFHREMLQRVFESVPPEQNWTDEASMLEFLGLPVAVIPGDRRNIKITYPEDFQYAECLLGQTSKE
ncbi:MAG: 2-C-methyl-D-erythritol 4-phosphate cytidylyltransferase [Acidobacteria bacterium]|nr:2-C-methyl-D-erythritol 4-phosphate cytidylyltransferase [Acidobacteriota bacterium]